MLDFLSTEMLEFIRGLAVGFIPTCIAYYANLRNNRYEKNRQSLAQKAVLFARKFFVK